ncbi:iron transporter FeoA [Desulfuribacillus stibiiarsenatis]|uniref:Iron transporter FeoA n=1 Tax=Desulfuribacillus stibiiarsenatis TaxID=1390249 RepID=A0A1E5L4Y9_9FIRM|nr:ferrous iron transport protein A [Desulfuribacillus stibiiarsenatis]OEH85232.1 iron transporter FeoA [Desulfuribacillus stibiiarsenatis]
MRKLNEVQPGERVKIERILLDERLRSRFMTLGLVPGIEIHVTKIAPLGDPIEITVRGYQLSLRKKEASEIIVKA